jgi:shikimate dehydrogenase
VEVLSLHDDEVVGEVVVSTIPAAAQTDDVVDAVRGRTGRLRGRLPPLADPARPSVLDAALSRGRPGQVLVTGLDLLVHQAALQFEQFTGFPAPLAGHARRPRLDPLSCASGRSSCVS